MSHVIAIARKELRAFFVSPVAFIFLGTFLLVTLAFFFHYNDFFNRNVADVRPLFSLLPVLLIFLTSAVTMRQWSEEQKLGTLELLMTLPVRVHHLVIGKFLAALLLVSVALALTFGVPLTVATMGDLDWGPVFGGYFGAVLLAGAYISIGLCISAMSDNQIVALILSTVVCSLLYAVGVVSILFGQDIGSFLAALGTGTRFESIRRGVLDIRDILYYLGIIVSFLSMNTLILLSKGWSTGPSTSNNRLNTRLTGLLVVVNVVVANFLFASFTSLRLDLTERGEYSVSTVTKDLLKQIDEPLIIRGYFSERTHEKLAPLVPRIRDLLDEYSTIGGANVITQYVDPTIDSELAAAAQRDYDIRGFPVEVFGRNEQSLVQAYFSILVQYGDRHEVLGYRDLIEFKATPRRDVLVQLRNLEYDLTRTIKKVAFGFETLDAAFAGMDEPAELTAFITPDLLPPEYQQAPNIVAAVVDQLEQTAAGKFKFTQIDPTDENALETPDTLYRKYGIRPAVAPQGSNPFYLHLLLRVGTRYELLYADADNEDSMRSDLEAAIKRSAPGFLKTVGLVTPAPKTPPPLPGRPPPPPPPPSTQALRRQLAKTYNVIDVDLSEGDISGDVDVLVLVQPAALTPKAQFAIDQHLMQGGTVIAFYGQYVFEPSRGDLFNVVEAPPSDGLDALLAKYGVELDRTMVLDPQSEQLVLEVPTTVQGQELVQLVRLRYPYFIHLRSENFATDNPAVSSLPSLTLPWSSPIRVSDPVAASLQTDASSEGDSTDGESADAEPTRTVVALVKSTDESYLDSSTEVMPELSDLQQQGGFKPPQGEQESRDLAVVVTGQFPSAFKGGLQLEDETLPGIESSPNSARLIVVGSSAFTHDVALGMLSREQLESNLEFVQNLIDLSLADTELLSIRSRGMFVRTLVPMDTGLTFIYEYANYAIALLGLGLVLVLTLVFRRTVPMKLVPMSELEKGKV